MPQHIYCISFFPRLSIHFVCSSIVSVNFGETVRLSYTRAFTHITFVRTMICVQYPVRRSFARSLRWHTHNAYVRTVRIHSDQRPECGELANEYALSLYFYVLFFSSAAAAAASSSSSICSSNALSGRVHRTLRMRFHIIFFGVNKNTGTEISFRETVDIELAWS